MRPSLSLGALLALGGLDSRPRRPRRAQWLPWVTCQLNHGCVRMEVNSVEAANIRANGGASVTTPRQPVKPLPPMKRAFTLAELRRHDGSQGELPILVSVLGRIYDVSAARDLWGPDGAYALFSGRDCTFNLAVMEFWPNTLNYFGHEFTDKEKESLASWIAYFDDRYGCPVGELADYQHVVRVTDLPETDWVPFSSSRKKAH